MNKEEIKEDPKQISARRLSKLRNGRHVSEIPFNDPFWTELKIHRGEKIEEKKK